MTFDNIASIDFSISHNVKVSQICSNTGYTTGFQIFFTKILDARSGDNPSLESCNRCLYFIFFIRCVRSARIWSYSGPHFPVFGLNTERYGESLCIQSECAKMRTRIAPNMDTFLRSDGYAMSLYIICKLLEALPLEPKTFWQFYKAQFIILQVATCFS